MPSPDEQQKLRTALSLHQAGNFGQAAAIYRQLIQSNPDNFHALHYLGAIEAAAGNFRQAKPLMARSLSIRPPNIQFTENYASVLFQSGDYEAALDASRRGLQLDHTNVTLAYVGAVALYKLKRLDEALAQFDTVLALAPRHVAAINERGSVLAQMKDYDAALAGFDRVLASQPTYAEAHLNKANLYNETRQYDAALSAYDTALALKPSLADAWLGRGNVFRHLNRHDEAFAAYDKALALNPDLAGAWVSRGHVLAEQKRFGESFAAYDKAFSLKPEQDFLPGERLYAKLYICDWNNIEAETSELLGAIRTKTPAAFPFAVLPIPSTPADQLQCAKSCVARRSPPQRAWAPKSYAHDRIRVAYLSCDFREHPVAYQLAGLFERHDRSRFEVSAMSYGPEQNSPTRKRLESACERFVDVQNNTDAEIARTIEQLEIDIAVDLVGHTQNARLGVFARRPAPVQVSYLGYLGTMGAACIDYVIADAVALPAGQQKNYSESIVHLPGCFLANDDTLTVGARTPSLRELGLPAEGFVFCSFNNSYKFTRPVFEAWMRLLRSVDGSVLWLLDSNAEMTVNLRREARHCGVDDGRIVFAPRVALADHMARQRAADLFLDTTPYNAGATAAVALWSGLPILAVLGETFVGRMAASMLHAVGLPELVTHSLDDYEALARKLATSPDLMASIRRKLADNLPTAPLFDTDRFRRNIEQAYATMIEMQRRGERPRGFAVEPS